jgi:hypothetical protein
MNPRYCVIESRPGYPDRPIGPVFGTLDLARYAAEQTKAQVDTEFLRTGHNFTYRGDVMPDGYYYDPPRSNWTGD